MKEVQKTPPKKVNVVAFTAIFLVTQFFYLATNFGNMPILRDTFNISAFPGFVLFFNTHYYEVDMTMSIIQLVLFIFLCKSFISKGFPSLITFITFFWNIIICAASGIGFYIMNARNIPISIQILFVLPVLSIFVSSVALIDDCADILRGTFQVYVSNTTRAAQKKFKRRIERVNELNPLANESVLEETTVLSAEEALQAHQQEIADAAVRAYPKFNNH